MSLDYKILAEIEKFCRVFEGLKTNVSVRPSEMSVLREMRQNSSVSSPAELARALRVSKPMISIHLNRLIQLGAVVKMPSADDGRSVLVVLTKKGKALVDQADYAVETFLDGLKSKMGEKKFETLIKSIVLANRVN